MNWLCLTAVALLPSIAWAGSKDDATAAANRAVRDVLRTEMQAQSDLTNRAEALQPTLEANPDHPAVHWQAGDVRSGKEWLPFDKATNGNAADSRLAEYRQRRDAAEKTFASQLELSNWCRKQKLNDQERSHLVQSLLLATPNQDVSRIYERLGYRRIGSEWVSRQDLADLERLAKETQTSLERWSPRLQPLASKLDGTIPQIRQAKEQLEQFSDSHAIPAIEAVLCTHSQFAATAAVDQLSRMDEYQASLALARQASFSPWKSVRELATKALQKRRLEDYVPDMISLMYTPIESRSQILRGIRGGLLLDWVLSREGRNEIQIHHLSASAVTLVHIVNLNRFTMISSQGLQIGTVEDFIPPRNMTSNVNRSIARSRKNFDLERFTSDLIYNRERQIDLQNEFMNSLNSRLGGTISQIIGKSEQGIADPHFWWNWWDDYSGVLSPEKRVVVVNEQVNEVVGPIPTLVRGSSCLVAGTPVWTDNGFVPIERISVGDHVLAKDIETGELAYKPVLHTTVRPPSPAFVFAVGDDSITASVGHNWWVSGAGWTKTRELRDGQPIHTATGMTRVRRVETAAEEKTYNLVVADFHTYFVGHSHILSHDVLPPRPTNRLVPGLVDE